MGEIHVHEFMTLDGVVDAPVWTADYGFDPGMGAVIGSVTSRCSAILLGRTTYDMFSQSWPDRSEEDDPGVPFFNGSTKYVVSATLEETPWQHTEKLGGYDADRIRRLKDEVEGDLYVSGSATLVHGLLADGLVDALHLFVYPTTRGGGPRLFADPTEPATYSLAQSETYDNGVLYLQYRA